MDRKTDGETNTLASRGLEEPAHASRGLEEPFFQLCCCVIFWFWREIGFGFYILLCTWSTIQLFSVVAGKFYYDRNEKVLVVCLVGCAVVSSFGSGGK